MNPDFNEIFTDPENEIFRVVFFPDRIYHEAYLNATVSSRYRYNVREVRSQHDITVIKGEVYQDSQYLCRVLRVEYRASRLVEVARANGRFLQQNIIAFIRVFGQDKNPIGEGYFKLSYCAWINAYEVELWETLEPRPGTSHDYKVLAMMGKDGEITCRKGFDTALSDGKIIQNVDVSFRENDIDMPFGYQINNPAWDNNYLRSYQVPNRPQPNSPENTVDVQDYRLTFQRGWFRDVKDVDPVKYRNAMMDDNNPERVPDNPDPNNKTNMVEMQWILQREFGSNIVYFHEVTVNPGAYEGSHRHIGSEELYYIIAGSGIAYMGEGDDPSTDHYPTELKQIYGVGMRNMKVLPVSPGKIIYTKSGGMHGIRNTSDSIPLKFVAFGYQSS